MLPPHGCPFAMVAGGSAAGARRPVIKRLRPYFRKHTMRKAFSARVRAFETLAKSIIHTPGGARAGTALSYTISNDEETTSWVLNQCDAWSAALSSLSFVKRSTAIGRRLWMNARRVFFRTASSRISLGTDIAGQHQQMIGTQQRQGRKQQMTTHACTWLTDQLSCVCEPEYFPVGRWMPSIRHPRVADVDMLSRNCMYRSLVTPCEKQCHASQNNLGTEGRATPPCYPKSIPASSRRR